MYNEFRLDNTEFDKYFESILQLGEEEFYIVITEKLFVKVKKIKEDKCLSLYAISCSEGFEDKLRKRKDKIRNKNFKVK